MALYTGFGSTAAANAAQNDLDAQEAGYASYADMLAQQANAGGPWAAIARGEQVDVWSTLVAVGQAMAPKSEVPASEPAPPDVTIPVAPGQPASAGPCGGLSAIACENLHCAENGGELLGDIATGMCVYQMIDDPYPDVQWPAADPGMVVARSPSKLPTLLLLGGAAVAAYLLLKR